MRIHWIRAWTAVAVLVTPLTALAQVTAAREQTFRERDRNHDGVLTQEEYGGHPGNFRAMDANGDHVLSRDEFVNRYREGNPPPTGAPIGGVNPAEPVDVFALIDRNHDNAITRSEWRPELVTATFPQTDRNHDGIVTRDEFANPLPADSAEARFAAMDRNNDGVLTRNEWRADPFSFNRADRNSDNRVTVDEYVNLPVGTTDGRFESLDRNRNGVINRNEWVGQSLPFDFVDRNNDDRISPDEFMNPPAAGDAERRFAVLDRNRNGVVNRGEWRGESMSFDDVDRNNDNRVTLDEYVAATQYGYDQGSNNDLAYRFTQYDRNRDGMLSRSEWRETTAAFNQADRNRDGYVSRSEYMYGNVIYENPRDDAFDRGRRFRELDDNDNGYISRAEWPYDRSEFDALDRDRDGRLSTYEFSTYNVSGTRPTLDQFRRMDDNGDGVISRAEWSGTWQSFSDYDRNRDGVISRDEFLY